MGSNGYSDIMDVAECKAAAIEVGFVGENANDPHRQTENDRPHGCRRQTFGPPLWINNKPNSPTRASNVHSVVCKAADLGCGPGNPGPSGCDNQCGSTAEDLGFGCGNIENEWCSQGVKNPRNDVCCNSSCGTCGGPGCSQRSGGVSQCCVRTIRDENRFCEDEFDVACKIPGVTTEGPTDDPVVTSVYTKTDCRFGYSSTARSAGDYGAHKNTPKTLEECEALCDANPECASFVVDQMGGGKCHLRTECPLVNEDCIEASSWNFINYVNEDCEANQQSKEQIKLDAESAAREYSMVEEAVANSLLTKGFALVGALSIVGAVMQKYLQYKNEDKYITIEQEI